MKQEEFDFAYGIIEQELDAGSRSDYASQIDSLPHYFAEIESEHTDTESF